MSAAPYPADTRAKGWRFELDYEQIEQSSTWALASAEARPWLLMMWMTAWRQVPCGSLTTDHAVIAAQIGMPPKLWAKHSAVMLRGWWAADDGRLYHPTLTKRVDEMMARRRSDSDRKARERMRKAEGRMPDSVGLPQESRVTPPGLPPDSSTDNRQPNTEYQDSYGGKPPALSSGAGVEAPARGDQSAAGAVCLALKACGIGKVSPQNQRLLMLLSAGAQVAEFTGFAGKALETAPGAAFEYVLGAVEGERKRAASTAPQLHRGAMPNKQQALENRNRAVGAEWLAQQGAA